MKCEFCNGLGGGGSPRAGGWMRCPYCNGTGRLPVKPEPEKSKPEEVTRAR